MKRIRQELKTILNNQHGVALMLIITSIVILMAVYGEFTFDSKISRLKATNILDRSQAKLLADSGLQLAMARLRLYKEAYNMVQNNQNAKSMVKPQLLNQLWEMPFIFPIPIGKGANRSFIDTVEKFQKETFLEGEMKISIQNISNRLNLNLLRANLIRQQNNANSPYDDPNSSLLDMNPAAIQSDVSIDQSLYYLLKKLVDDKKEKDEAFEDRYGNLNYQELMTNLKFFMSDYQSMNSDPLVGEAELTYERTPLTPKFGPLGSSSELYAIPGWNDELIELIQNEFSVYPAAKIDLNKLTANMLRIIIPGITEDGIKDFFEYRDDPETPHYFNTMEDFKRYIVDIAHLMSEQSFNERVTQFNNKGISFGANPNLFRIVSEGTMNRSTYTLVAYVVIPTNESLINKTNTTSGAQGGGNNTNKPPANQGNNNGTDNKPGTGGDGSAQNTQLLEPRVIEIQIN